jgi:hypothetical protein
MDNKDVSRKIFIPANNIVYKNNVDNYDYDRLISIFEKAKNKIDRQERNSIKVPFDMFNKNKKKKI